MNYEIEELFWILKTGGGYSVCAYMKPTDPTITEIEIPAEYNGEPVVKIARGAFEGAEYLKSVKLPKSVKEIAPGAFRLCPELERVEINGKPKINLNAFSTCPKLPPETVVMGLVCSVDITSPVSKEILQTITKYEPGVPCDCFRRDVFELLVKNDCFRGRGLKRVFYGMINNNKGELFPFAESHGMLDDAELVDALITDSAKHQRTEITAYLLDLKNRKFGFDKMDELELSETDELFRFELDTDRSRGGYALAEYLKKDDPSITELELPAEYKGRPVTMICNSSFARTKYLKRVVIPPSVRYIAMYAFFECEALESVRLPDSPLKLGCFAFSFCENLEHVEFGDPMPEFKQRVFQSCAKLSPEMLAKSMTRFTDRICRTDYRSTLDEYWSWECDSLRPEVFEILAKNKCYKMLNVKFLFEKMISENRGELLLIAEKHGMLENARLLELLISYAIEQKNVEITAYLLELKRRKFGFNGGDKFEL